MTRRFIALSASVIFSLACQTAWAHPGHGSSTDSSSASHYLLEPAHASVFAAGVVAMVLAAALAMLIRRSAKHVDDRS